ncbi:hypothetical protein QFZ82_007402 [Streptomyces sp. V4I23]|uniref:hypothetical protein n=1 Tax=Streptomyces sp. V4I23 TaxID=3042282 RepID=UPI00277FADE0|nr:hypothetical protein [Streptomyces sp. V4I23]MDQ1012917.1 hypothetical protein [Streptomyces sp. V4I23]
MDFALFMVDAVENDALVREAPAIVGRLLVVGPRPRPHGGRGLTTWDRTSGTA